MFPSKQRLDGGESLRFLWVPTLSNHIDHTLCNNYDDHEESRDLNEEHTRSAVYVRFRGLCQPVDMSIHFQIRKSCHCPLVGLETFGVRRRRLVAQSSAGALAGRWSECYLAPPHFPFEVGMEDAPNVTLCPQLCMGISPTRHTVIGLFRTIRRGYAGKLYKCNGYGLPWRTLGANTFLISTALNAPPRLVYTYSGWSALNEGLPLIGCRLLAPRAWSVSRK